MPRQHFSFKTEIELIKNYADIKILIKVTKITKLLKLKMKIIIKI